MTMQINGTSGLVFNDASTQNTAATGFGFKNRILNGNMVLDQRNAGASVTPANGVVTFITDRWGVSVNQSSKLTAQQSTTAPTGFTNSLLITSSSAYSLVSTDVFVLTQKIEGFNTADFAWGTASASPVTVSFKVRSSLTGTFGGVIRNSGSNRFYPFTYTINSANTFEDKTITIAGDTTGTWLTNNGTGLELIFSVGVGSSYLQNAGAWTSSFALSAVGSTSLVGTNGATFYITGVQLEKGSTATSFDYRPYGTELALCQRYYYRVKANSGGSQFGSGYNFSGSVSLGYIPFPVTMRTTPSAVEQSGTASDYGIYRAGDSVACTAVPSFNTSDQWCATVAFTATGNLTAGQGTIVRAFTTSNGFLGFSAEL